MTDESKTELIRSATELLKENGVIIIGDVAFVTRVDLENCRQKAGDGWDKDEIYFVFEELKQSFPKLKFEQVSYCAGLLSLER